MRSHRAEDAAPETTRSLLGLWAMGLHAQVELMRHDVLARRISVAGVLRADRKSMHEYKGRLDPGESLLELLSRAVIDPYRRADETSRDYPRREQPRAIGAPRVRRAATRARMENARQYQG